MVGEGDKLRKSLKKYRNKTGHWRIGGSILKTKTREEESEPRCSRGSTCKWRQVSLEYRRDVNGKLRERQSPQKRCREIHNKQTANSEEKMHKIH